MQGCGALGPRVLRLLGGLGFREPSSNPQTLSKVYRAASFGLAAGFTGFLLRDLGFNLSYHDKATPLSTLDPHYGNLNTKPLTRTQFRVGSISDSWGFRV